MMTETRDKMERKHTDCSKPPKMLGYANARQKLLTVKNREAFWLGCSDKAETLQKDLANV